MHSRVDLGDDGRRAIVIPDSPLLGWLPPTLIVSPEDTVDDLHRASSSVLRGCERGASWREAVPTALHRSVVEVLDACRGGGHVESAAQLWNDLELRLRGMPLEDGAVALAFEARPVAQANPSVARRLAAIVENSEDAIIAHDLNGVVESWNGGAERLYGYRAAEIVGESIFTIVPDDRVDELRSALGRLRQGQRVAAFETCRRRNDGARVDVSINLSVLRDDRGSVIGVSAIDRDIREQLETRRRLRVSESKFRATFEAAAVGIAHVGLDGRWLRFNARLCELTGYSPAELRERTIYDVTHSDDRQADRSGLAALLEGQTERYRAEKRYVRKDGSFTWVQVSAAVVRDGDGAPLYFVGILSDIGDRVQLAKRLEESEERMRVAAKVAKVGTFEWRVPTDENIWTPEIAALYGVSLEEFDGTYASWRPLVHPDDLAHAERAVNESLETGVYQAEFRVVWRDGTVRWLEARGWLEHDDHGEPVRLIGVNFDITERKRVEAELRASEERYRVALEGGELGTWVTDYEAGTVRWDARMAAIVGHPSRTDPMPLHEAIAFVHPDDRERVAAELQRARHEPRFEVEQRVITSDGDIRWIRSSGVVTRGDEGRRIIGVVQDVTPQKRASMKLEEASRRKDDYLAMLSHELRNPLASIRLAGHLMQRQPHDNAELASAAAILERQSAHMAMLLDGLLDVSRISRGKLSIEPTSVELVSLLRDVVHDRQPQARTAEVHIELNSPSGDPIYVHADRNRLVQVFDNLISNALKFTDAGGQISIAVEPRGHDVLVEVRDTGAGFSPELGEHLFEAFQQGPQDLARKSGGLGLGLALVRGLVELHHGLVWGQSPGEGQGSTFSVQLPTVQAQAPQAAAIRSNGAERRDDARVLLIEDNADSAEMMRLLLENAGFRVAVEHRGDRGVARALAEPPEVIFCDIPQKLRSEGATAHVRLIALTGYGRPEDRARSLEAGFDDHLTKPVDIERAIDAIGS